jgi:hypothetical protein
MTGFCPGVDRLTAFRGYFGQRGRLNTEEIMDSVRWNIAVSPDTDHSVRSNLLEMVVEQAKTTATGTGESDLNNMQPALGRLRAIFYSFTTAPISTIFAASTRFNVVFVFFSAKQPLRTTARASGC